MMRFRVVLAEDQDDVRAALRQLLEGSGRVSIVGEARDGLELLRLLDRVRCDAVLLDLEMPRLNGFEALRALSRRSSRPPAITLSMHDSAAHVDRALSLGAAGYVLKSARPEEIIDAIAAAMVGGAYIQPSIAQPLLKRHLVLTDGAQQTPTSLSPRQRELIRALSMGLGNKAIAHRLGIAEETVKSYLKELYPRIGVSSRASAVAWALRNGLID